MVESTGFENRQAGNGLEGSNPSLSANFETRKKFAESAAESSDFALAKWRDSKAAGATAPRRGRAIRQQADRCDLIPPTPRLYFLCQ